MSEETGSIKWQPGPNPGNAGAQLVMSLSQTENSKGFMLWIGIL